MTDQKRVFKGQASFFGFCFSSGWLQICLHLYWKLNKTLYPTEHVQQTLTTEIGYPKQQVPSWKYQRVFPPMFSNSHWTSPLHLTSRSRPELQFPLYISHSFLGTFLLPGKHQSLSTVVKTGSSFKVAYVTTNIPPLTSSMAGTLTLTTKTLWSCCINRNCFLALKARHTLPDKPVKPVSRYVFYSVLYLCNGGIFMCISAREAAWLSGQWSALATCWICARSSRVQILGHACK